MHTVKLQDVQANFDQLLQRARDGETIMIDDETGPAYSLDCVRTHKGIRFGLLKDVLGDISDIEAALNGPMPDDVLIAFGDVRAAADRHAYLSVECHAG
jgi:hypothetical protein